MKPVLLIHGYSTEGKDKTVEEIYGTLPKRISDELGDDSIEELNLSRWISLDDGVSIDDISFAMDRALKSEYSHILDSGFHVVIHSTGALVVRNWIKNYGGKPSPVENLVHLAGANFGSGLAHLGKGQLARWGRFIFAGTRPGVQVLDDLEFGAWNTLDLHRHFLSDDNDMLHDYEVREFCLIGSQVFAGSLRKVIEMIPIRYPKEDSSDNTVRTSAGNLNYNYVDVTPTHSAYELDCDQLLSMVDSREHNEAVDHQHYHLDTRGLSQNRQRIPYAILWETAHFGEDIGIVDGEKSRSRNTPLIVDALKVSDAAGYQSVIESYEKTLKKTLVRAADSKRSFVKSWSKQSQYEGHSQVIFRVRDQFGESVDHLDITFHSRPKRNSDQKAIERLIEDKHVNAKNKGTLTFYLRVMEIDNGDYRSLLEDVAPLELEVTGYEPLTDNIAYVPMRVKLNPALIQKMIKPFETTVVDVVLARLPADKVFAIKTKT